MGCSSGSDAGLSEGMTAKSRRSEYQAPVAGRAGLICRVCFGTLRLRLKLHADISQTELPARELMVHHGLVER